MDIDLQHLHDGNFGSVLEQIAKHGVTTSRIIAYGLLRGTWSARLLNRPLAWYIRQHMPMQGLAELAKIIVLMSTSEAFVSIIASVASLISDQGRMRKKKEREEVLQSEEEELEFFGLK